MPAWFWSTLSPFHGWLLEKNTFLELNKLMTFGAFALASPRFHSSSISSGACGAGEADHLGQSVARHHARVEHAHAAPHGNFAVEPVVYRGPYEYSVPGADKDYTPQWEKAPGQPEPVIAPWPQPTATETTLLRRSSFLTAHGDSLQVTARPDTGLWNAKIGIWLFLASEVMLFGGLFSSYVFLRIGADYPWPVHELIVWPGFVNTFVLIASSVTVVFSWAFLKMRQYRTVPHGAWAPRSLCAADLHRSQGLRVLPGSSPTGPSASPTAACSTATSPKPRSSSAMFTRSISISKKATPNS